MRFSTRFERLVFLWFIWHDKTLYVVCDVYTEKEEAFLLFSPFLSLVFSGLLKFFRLCVCIYVHENGIMEFLSFLFLFFSLSLFRISHNSFLLAKRVLLRGRFDLFVGKKRKGRDNYCLLISRVTIPSEITSYKSLGLFISKRLIQETRLQRIIYCSISLNTSGSTRSSLPNWLHH